MAHKIYGQPVITFTNVAPIEVSTAAEMTALLVSDNVGKAYKYTGTTDENYTNGDIYVVELATYTVTATVPAYNSSITGIYADGNCTYLSTETTYSGTYEVTSTYFDWMNKTIFTVNISPVSANNETFVIRYTK